MSLILDGTNGLSDVDGTAAAPAIRGTDANTGIFFGADIIGFSEGGAEAMRIDASGNVGIGIATASNRLTVAEAGGATQRFVDTTSTVFSLIQNGSNGDFTISADHNNLGASTNIIFKSDGAIERARIDSSGIMLIGATSARTSQAKLELRSSANTALSLYMFKDTQVEANLGFKSGTDSNFYVGSGGTSVGTNGVYLTNTGSSWNAVSDERMKTIVEPIANAAAKVASLRSVIGYYNNDEKQIRRPFLIAQDVQAVLPEAVNIQDQETGTLGMSYTDTIPLLVAAIKELKAIVDAQAARIAALEAA